MGHRGDVCLKEEILIYIIKYDNKFISGVMMIFFKLMRQDIYINDMHQRVVSWGIFW